MTDRPAPRPTRPTWQPPQLRPAPAVHSLTMRPHRSVSSPSSSRVPRSRAQRNPGIFAGFLSWARLPKMPGPSLNAPATPLRHISPPQTPQTLASAALFCSARSRALRLRGRAAPRPPSLHRPPQDLLCGTRSITGRLHIPLLRARSGFSPGPALGERRRPCDFLAAVGPRIPLTPVPAPQNLCASPRRIQKPGVPLQRPLHELCRAAFSRPRR